jgi:hypothetical protein
MIRTNILVLSFLVFSALGLFACTGSKKNNEHNIYYIDWHIATKYSYKIDDVKKHFYIKKSISQSDIDAILNLLEFSRECKFTNINSRVVVTLGENKPIMDMGESCVYSHKFQKYYSNNELARSYIDQIIGD